jgi:hypothetical protein
MTAPTSSTNNKSGDAFYAGGNNADEGRQPERETLLPVLDKSATIHTLMRQIDEEVEEVNSKDWKLEDDDDEVYVMSEDDFRNEEEANGQEGDINNEEGEDGQFQEMDENSSDFSEYSEGDAEMVIEDPFEPVLPQDDQGDKHPLEAISLDNIIPSGRRRNQQII